MFRKQNLIMFVLIAFCGCLSINGYSKIEKVGASEVVWEEAATIVSGKSYLITAKSGEVTYLLPTGTNTSLITGHVLSFTEVNTNLWTFTFNANEGKYQIVDTGGNILYANGNIATQRILASNNVGGVDEANRYWTLENNVLKTGSTLQWTISFEPDYDTWLSKSHEDRISNLNFYTLITNELAGEANSFSAWIMEQPDGDIATLQCSAKYQTAKEKWNELTLEAQELFKSSPSFNETRRRLTNWAIANGETIEDFYNNDVLGKRNEKSTNNGIIFSLFSAILLVSGLIISKRVKAKE